MKESTGSQLRKFRIRSKLSQLDLENNINASPGYISKLELDKVKPTKHSIDKIVKVLNLTPLEATAIYDISTQFITEFIEVTNNFNKAKTIGEVFEIYANEVNKVFNLNGGALYIVEDGEIKLNLMSDDINVSLAKMIIKIPDHSIIFDIERDTDNPVVQVYNSQQYKIVHDLYEIMYPFISKDISNLAQNTTNLKCMIIIPLVFNQKCIGIAIYGTHLNDGFDNNLELFTKINNIAAECLYNILHKN